MFAFTRTGMRRREGREKAGRGRKARAVPVGTGGFAGGGDGGGVGLGGRAVVLRLLGRR